MSRFFKKAFMPVSSDCGDRAYACALTLVELRPWYDMELKRRSATREGRLATAAKAAELANGAHLHRRLPFVDDDPVCQVCCHNEVVLHNECCLLAAHDEPLDHLDKPATRTVRITSEVCDNLHILQIKHMRYSMTTGSEVYESLPLRQQCAALSPDKPTAHQ